MSFITELLNFSKKCCCPFLQHQTNNQNNLSQSLIEMSDISLSSDNKTTKLTNTKNIFALHNKKSAQYQQSLNNELSQVNNGLSQVDKTLLKAKSFNQQLHQKDHQQVLNTKLKRFQSIQPNKITYTQSQSSFQTIKSTISKPLSRRNFKIVGNSNTLSKIKKSDSFYSLNQSQNSVAGETHMVNYKGYTQANMQVSHNQIMATWVKLEYQKSTFSLPPLSSIVRMKFQTKDSFDSLVHKLQDYYTFYYQITQQNNQSLQQKVQHTINNEGKYHQQQLSSINQLQHHYCQKNKQLLCSITKSDYTKSFDYQKTCKYMSLCIIPNCHLSSYKFIQWFNQLQIQSIYYNFNRIQYVDGQYVQDKMQYPFIRIQQFGEELVNKQTFMIASLIQQVQFDHQQQQSLLQTSFQIISQQLSYQRLIRITSNNDQTVRVEIYTESSQNIRQTNQNIHKIKNYEFQYFQNRWKLFQQRLNKDKVINKKPIQIFRN